MRGNLLDFIFNLFFFLEEAYCKLEQNIWHSEL